ncbi:unnamed protein product [Pleuronectes platessa]|uniref:Uncharacterized protein n=1 Tax=Pleuronectes platessa TaxID=8262 RepID=A0A9N7Y6Q3_PLEPL|nr:unnamed protein product [Pleuronectes platessa]
MGPDWLQNKVLTGLVGDHRQTMVPVVNVTTSTNYCHGCSPAWPACLWLLGYNHRPLWQHHSICKLPTSERLIEPHTCRASHVNSSVSVRLLEDTLMVKIEMNPGSPRLRRDPLHARNIHAVPDEAAPASDKSLDQPVEQNTARSAKYKRQRRSHGC